MTRILAALGILLALGAVACASTEPARERVRLGSEESSPPGRSPGGSGTSSRRVDPRQGGFEVGLGEWAVTLEAAAIRPGPVTFVIHNGGEQVHGFEMELENVDDGFKVETRTFGPGETVTLELDLAPGLYKVECLVDGHDNLGMEALLEVRPNAPKVRQSGSGGGGNAISIHGFAFNPAEVSVGPGGEVAWKNDDPAPHTVTATDGSFDSGTIQPGQSFSVQVDAAGTVTYFCEIHPTMEGTIRVGLSPSY